MDASWSLKPLKTTTASWLQPASGTTVNTGMTGYKPMTTTQPSAPAAKPATTYALGTATGATNMSGAGQPGTNQGNLSGQGTYNPQGTGTNTGTYRPDLPPSPVGGQASWGSPDPFTPIQQPGTMRAPGAYEQWYEQNKSRYSQPTTLSSYYNQVSGKFAGQRFQPTNSQGAYNQVQQRLGSPSYGQQNAQSISTQLRGQSAGEGFMGAAAGMFTGRNNATDFYGQSQGRIQAGANQTDARRIAGQLEQRTQGEGAMDRAVGMFGGPNQTNNYYGQVRDQFSAPGDIEYYWDSTQDDFTRAGLGERYAQDELRGTDWGNIDQMLRAQNYGNSAIMDMQSAQGMNQRTAGVFNENRGLTGRNLVGQELDYFRDPLRANSYSEDLYESGNQGLNTYYDRENEKRTRELQDRMAAMGVFGSGETVEGMAEISAELGSQQARDMAGLAQQADQARLARAGALTDMAGAAGQEELARVDMLRQLGMDADQIGQGNAQMLLDAYGLASDEGLGKMDRYLQGQGVALGAIDRGLAADRLGLDRLTAGANVADMSSRFGLDRTMAGGELARSADDSRWAQAAGLSGAGAASASAELARRQAAAQTYLNAAGEERQWLDMGADMAKNADESRWAQAAGLASTGNMMSTAELNRLNASSAMGLARDQEERLRMNDMFRAADDLDENYRQAQEDELTWLTTGGSMAGAVDTSNLNWLNAGRDAASTAQDKFERRERYGITDAVDLANGMSGAYGAQANIAASEQAQYKQDAINLLMAQYGLDAATAERAADEWAQVGYTTTWLLQYANQNKKPK